MNDGVKQPSDFPYSNYPQDFDRTPLSIVPIDYSLAKLLALHQEIDGHWLSENDHKEIEKGLKNLRHSGFNKRYTSRHQLGGILPLLQEHQEVPCPNSKCKNHKEYQEGYSCFMKELAVFFNDPYSGLPMIEKASDFESKAINNEWVQLVFWVCDECFAISTSNCCD